MRPVRWSSLNQRKASYKTTEHRIQQTILDYMRYHGIYAWRMNAGRMKVGTGAYERWIMLGAAGIPDIIGVCGPQFKKGKFAGRMMAVEVKQPKKGPTEIQERTINELKEYGALVEVIHSIDELEEWFKNL